MSNLRLVKKNLLFDRSQVLFSVIASYSVDPVGKSDRCQSAPCFLHRWNNLPLVLLEVESFCCVQAVALNLLVLHLFLALRAWTSVAANSVHLLVWAKYRLQLVSLLAHVGQSAPLSFLQIETVKLSENVSRVTSTEEDLAFISFNTGGETRARFRHFEGKNFEFVRLKVVFFNLCSSLSIDLLSSEQKYSWFWYWHGSELGPGFCNLWYLFPYSSLNIIRLTREKLWIVKAWEDVYEFFFEFCESTHWVRVSVMVGGDIEGSRARFVRSKTKVDWLVFLGRRVNFLSLGLFVVVFILLNVSFLLTVFGWNRLEVLILGSWLVRRLHRIFFNCFYSFFLLLFVAS